ncbi:hypothetical protein A1332_21335 [Methylomonas methanica]|uniref:Uncharacterized protein n=1 Tax=Methylomonas methanica TaxID=421 RepID=A0A177LWW8_METMH|nr:hypothetical protein A1332_21335 [Methylomonas methanica]
MTFLALIDGAITQNHIPHNWRISRQFEGDDLIKKFALKISVQNVGRQNMKWVSFDRNNTERLLIEVQQTSLAGTGSGRQYQSAALNSRHSLLA